MERGWKELMRRVDGGEFVRVGVPAIGNARAHRVPRAASGWRLRSFAALSGLEHRVLLYVWPGEPVRSSSDINYYPCLV